MHLKITETENFKGGSVAASFATAMEIENRRYRRAQMRRFLPGNIARRIWRACRRLYWHLWYRLWFSKVESWGVQWAWKDYRAYDDQGFIEDRVFRTRAKAVAFWREILPKVRPTQEAVLWRIDRGDYVEVLGEVNYWTHKAK